MNVNGRPQVENPKKKVLGVRVTSDEHEQITQYAKEHHKTISQVVLERLEFLQEKNKSN
ncbi:MAG: CopG family transcriptional regulator [Agathobacter sp.]|nr:CopG family transcriptional regulator [Agathobacter sp.]